MSPAFSHCFLKRLSAFSKLSSGSTITLVTRSSPLSFLPEALPVYHAPIGLATHAPLGVPRAQFLHPLPPRPLRCCPPPNFGAHASLLARFGSGHAERRAAE